LHPELGNSDAASRHPGIDEDQQLNHEGDFAVDSLQMQQAAICRIQLVIASGGGSSPVGKEV
jgi:hypothetical protein